MTNLEFHNTCSNMLGKKVKIILNNNYQTIGYFNDEFLDDNSILINNGTLVTIKLEAIKNIELLKE